MLSRALIVEETVQSINIVHALDDDHAGCRGAVDQLGFGVADQLGSALLGYSASSSAAGPLGCCFDHRAAAGVADGGVGSAVRSKARGR